MKWKELKKIAISAVGFKYASGRPSLSLHDMVNMYIEKYIREFYLDLEKIVIITDGSVGVANSVETSCGMKGIKNLVIPVRRWLELESSDSWKQRNIDIISLANELIAFRARKNANPCVLNAIELATEKGIQVQTWTPASLHSELKIPIAPIIKIPVTAPQKEARQFKTWVKQAGLDKFKSAKDIEDYFEKDIHELVDTKKRKKKKRKLKVLYVT